MKNFGCILSLALLGMLAVSPSVAETERTTMTRTDTALGVRFANGTAVEFLLDEGRLVGLRRASVAGMALTSGQTVLRPIVADDAWETDEAGDPWVVFATDLEEVETDEAGRVVLTLGRRASRDAELIKQVYVWAGDPERAMGEAITEPLRQAKAKADGAMVWLDAAADETAAVKAVHAEIAAAKQRLEEAEQKTKGRGKWIKKATREIEAAQKALPKARESVWPELAKSDEQLAAAVADVASFRVMRQKRALEVGKIHRDYFGSVIFQLPAEANVVAAAKALSGVEPKDAFDAGTLRWVIEPVEVNVAGWPYRGWRHHYEVELAEGLTTRYLRDTGTWELKGEAVGTTVIATRYRGLGGIEETFGKHAAGGIDRNFTTTETIPGAAGGAPLISPVVPPSETQQDRGFGLRHRASPWIGRLVRGAGSQMFDFQVRPSGVFASFPDRLNDLRAVTESFQGDAVISQINEEAFPRGAKLKTTPMYYVVLTAPGGSTFALHERRTRWQEMDQYTRDRVSKELGFVQAEPLPGVGLNLDTAWEPRIRTLTDRMDKYAEMGMKMIHVHQPGWMNGRGLRQCKVPELKELASAGGGDCSIYDYVPRDTVGVEWKALTRKLAEHEVVYIVWSSYFSVGPGQFIQELREKHGLTAEAFAGWDKPEAMGDRGDIFQRLRVPHNPNNATVRDAYVARIENAAETWGHHGLWADSFQKWALVVGNDAKRPPSFRAWMEQYAKWSQKGMAFVSEGHGSPVMSCSIELSEQKFEDEWWFLPHTALWYRGNSKPPGAGTVEADRHVFRLMANKCWTYPETGWGQDVLEIIPDFARLAHEYNAALSTMRRSYVLPDGGGTLWLDTQGEKNGVWFPFKDGQTPAGVAAGYVLEEQRNLVDSVVAYRTYRVTGDDLFKAFGIRRGPELDPRVGREHPRVKYRWPAWAKPHTASAHAGTGD